ncbi:HAMP domain-containing sensor histidine kinase [Plantactinospora sp. B24E8]|uniref:sensor histidine kinase n=1 Tax=Plantactinospora sp. B24E8 TaxID=3153567 RepID=UPI00325E137F
MRWLSVPRWRIVLLCTVALFVGYHLPLLIKWAFGWLWPLRGICDVEITGVQPVCHQLADNFYLVGTGLLVGVVLLALLVAAFAARWALRPVRVLTESISHVGPQNLGYRVRATGRDELGQLSGAIDQMMERIAAGYEGQRRFAANASHELRTPLAVQRTLIEVGMAQPLTNDQVELLTAQLLQTNERNERLIEGLLALSESDQGLRARNPERLDEIAAEVVAAYQERARAAEVTLTGQLVPRVVVGERVLLERLVTNLVENAIKYNRPGGTVHVTVAAVPALTVVNTGPPVPAEAVAGLFEPFRRLSGDRLAHGGGAGLGLTIARSITQAHDGVISAVPAGPEGLRVEVRLPGPT